MKIKTINKRDLIKHKISCTMKETISKVKRQPSEQKKIIANETTDEELILQNIQAAHAVQWTTQPKVGQRTKRHFSREDIQMANKHMKRCSTPLIVKQMQIKTTVRYHLTQVRMAVIKKNWQTINAGESVKKREPSYTVCQNANWYSHLENSAEIP